MSYEVLARKYRPALFAEVVGQDHILQALQNSLISGNLHQAFIFSEIFIQISESSLFMYQKVTIIPK